MSYAQIAPGVSTDCVIDISSKLQVPLDNVPVTEKRDVAEAATTVSV
jgi:hypothetical protein